MKWPSSEWVLDQATRLFGWICSLACFWMAIQVVVPDVAWNRALSFSALAYIGARFAAENVAGGKVR